jgi:hypothetical protein
LRLDAAAAGVRNDAARRRNSRIPGWRADRASSKSLRAKRIQSAGLPGGGVSGGIDLNWLVIFFTPSTYSASVIVPSRFKSHIL